MDEASIRHWKNRMETSPWGIPRALDMLRIPVKIQMPAVSDDPAFDAMVLELRRRISEASGKEKAKLEKKLARELAYHANLCKD